MWTQILRNAGPGVAYRSERLCVAKNALTCRGIIATSNNTCLIS